MAKKKKQKQKQKGKTKITDICPLCDSHLEYIGNEGYRVCRNVFGIHCPYFDKGVLW